MGSMKVSFCVCCEDLVGFRIERRKEKEVYKGKEIEYEFNFGVCNECGAEVSTDIEYNFRKSRKKVRAYNALGGEQLRID